MAPVEVVAEVPPVDASADANAARKKPRRRGRKSKGGAQAENVAGAVSESHEAAPIPAPVASVRDESATMEMPSSSSHGPRRHPVIPQGRVFGTVHDVVEDAPVGFDALDDEAKTYFKSIEELLTEDAMLLQSDEGRMGMARVRFSSCNDKVSRLHSIIDRDLLLQNIYTEVDGKELLLAADYDGSRIMEKLIRVSSDFHRRVLMDRFRGRFRDLVQHRFASHVVQTLLTLGAQMVAQAADGSASAEQEKSATEGELLAMEQYILDFCGVCHMGMDCGVCLTSDG